MGDFKDGRTLLEEQRAKGKLGVYERPIPEAGEPRPGSRNMRRPKDNLGEVCEQWAPEGCKPSQEAFKLGLAKTIFPCQGLVPPFCTIRKQLASGMTVQEIYEKR